MKTMRRNLAARSPLLRKGGAHQATPSGTRQRVRACLAAAVEEWEEEREQERTAPAKGKRHKERHERRSGKKAGEGGRERRSAPLACRVPLSSAQ